MLVVTLVLIAVTGVTAPVMFRRISLATKTLSAGYAAFGLLAALLFRPDSQNLVGLDRDIDTNWLEQSPLTVVEVFLFFGLCVYVGSLLPYAINPGIVTRRQQGRRIAVVLPPKVLFLCALAVVCEVVGVGWGTLLNAPTYLASTGPRFLLNIGSILLPVSALAGGNVLVGQPNRGPRFAAGILLLLTEAVLFAQATRTFAVFFVLVWAGGWLTGRWTRRVSVVTGAISVFLAFALIGVPLYLRGQSEHGLLPGLHYLFSDPAAMISHNSNPLYNIFLGAPITLYVWKNVPPIPPDALITSLNPLPGGLTDWASVSRGLRLNVYEPYDATGELLNHGLLVATVFMLAVGAIIESLGLVARITRGGWQTGMQAMLVGAAGLILIRSTQYNLRTEARLIIYVSVAVGVMWLLSLRGGSSRDEGETSSRLTGLQSTR